MVFGSSGEVTITSLWCYVLPVHLEGRTKEGCFVLMEGQRLLMDIPQVVKLLLRWLKAAHTTWLIDHFQTRWMTTSQPEEMWKMTSARDASSSHVDWRMIKKMGSDNNWLVRPHDVKGPRCILCHALDVFCHAQAKKHLPPSTSSPLRRMFTSMYSFTPKKYLPHQHFDKFSSFLCRLLKVHLLLPRMHALHRNTSPGSVCRLLIFN